MRLAQLEKNRRDEEKLKNELAAKIKAADDKLEIAGELHPLFV